MLKTTIIMMRIRHFMFLVSGSRASFCGILLFPYCILINVACMSANILLVTGGDAGVTAKSLRPVRAEGACARTRSGSA